MSLNNTQNNTQDNLTLEDEEEDLFTEDEDCKCSGEECECGIISRRFYKNHNTYHPIYNPTGDLHRDLYTKDEEEEKEDLPLINELYMLFVEDNQLLYNFKWLIEEKKIKRKLLNYIKKNIIKKIINVIPFLKYSFNRFYKKKISKKTVYYIKFYVNYPYSQYTEYMDKTEIILKKIQTVLNEKLNKENFVIFIDIEGVF